MRIALFGVAFFPQRTAGEKNFFLQLTPLLRKDFDDIIVISVNDQSENHFTLETATAPVRIYNFKRPFHIGDASRFSGVTNGLFHYHHCHGSIQELAEKFLTVAYHASRIKKLFEYHKIDLVYFMDNFGFGMKYLKYITGKKVAFAAAHYEPSIVFYDTMQSYFLKKLDAVIPFSNAYNKILSRLQVPLEKLHTIPWGVDTNTFEVVSDKKREDLRKRFGLKKDAFIVLWTGPIQQIQEPDYYKSVSCARQAIQNDPDIEFIFCFKPEGYREKYQNDSGPQLTVLNGHSDFGNLLGCVDLLFSPIHKLDSTVSPPLTWVEAMSRGVPLITTQVLGADEIIDNNVNGFITNNYDTLVSDLERIKADGISNEVRSRAREKINANYNIELIARKYLEIFTNKIGCQEP